jgi:hypothetical protein
VRQSAGAHRLHRDSSAIARSLRIPATRAADLLIAQSYTYDKNVSPHMSNKTWKEHKAELTPKRFVAINMSTNTLRHLGSLDCEITEDEKVFEI